MQGKNLNKKFNSIKFKTWLTFFMMIVLIVILLWVFQVLFYNSFYRSMKRSRVESLGENLAKTYVNNPSFWNSLPDIARKNNVTIYFFCLKETESGKEAAFDIRHAVPNLSAGEIYLDELDWSDRQFDEFYAHVEAGEQTFSYLSAEENYVIYGHTLSFTAQDTYLYIASYIEPGDSTTQILSTMLIVVTVMCVFISIFIAFFFSGQITKPITDFSKEAEKLASGDFNVKFPQDSYNEINVLSGTLNFAVEEMEKTESFRREFIANVSHDLRTPLTMVKAYAEMIRDISGKNDQKRTQHAQVIIDEAERLNSLVADIQNLSKLQAGTDAIQAEKFDLSGLCARVINRFGVMNEKFGYVIEKQMQENVEVYADSRKIEQVLYNLLGNAINYTGADKKVYLILAVENDKARVIIRDTGKGIAPDEIDSVWDRYYRANQVKRKIVGSGLGLSIVKNILVLHDAEYGVESEVGKGTDFWFCLPLYGSKNK